jgi:hypothetical protein
MNLQQTNRTAYWVAVFKLLRENKMRLVWRNDSGQTIEYAVTATQTDN